MPRTFNLHKSRSEPDWQFVAEDDQNAWQKIAVKTKGVITPGNLVSIVGAVVVIAGLLALTREVSLPAIAMVVLGRMADLLDGAVAEATGTKSPLGEAVDATTDKILAIMAVVLLYAADIMPVIILFAIALHSIINSIITVAGKLKKKELHPVKEGKLAVAAAWIILLLHSVHSLLQNNEVAVSGIILFFAWFGFLIFIGLAIKSAYIYYLQLSQPSRDVS